MSKPFLRVNVGLLDPKHVERMEAAVWLYLYLHRYVDWETGVVPLHLDSEAAEALGKSERTVRRWRRNLEEDDYIICTPKRRGVQIQITKYTRPTGRRIEAPPPPPPEKSSDFGKVVRAWENVRGTISPFEADQLGALIEDWDEHREKLNDVHPDKGAPTATVVIKAIHETGKSADRPNLKYTEAVLGSWMRYGVGSRAGKKKVETTADLIEKKRKEMLRE